MSTDFDREKFYSVGVAATRQLITKLGEVGRQHRNLSKGEKKILMEFGPLIFMQGSIWTLDNVAVRTDKEVEAEGRVEDKPSEAEILKQMC